MSQILKKSETLLSIVLTFISSQSCIFPNCYQQCSVPIDVLCCHSSVLAIPFVNLGVERIDIIQMVYGGIGLMIS